MKITEKKLIDLEDISHWCYRIVKQTTKYGPVFHIHEVYFNKIGTPLYMSPPCHPMGENRDELVEDLKLMREAFSKAVLDYDEWLEE